MKLKEINLNFSKETIKKEEIDKALDKLIKEEIDILNIDNISLDDLKKFYLLENGIDRNSGDYWTHMIYKNILLEIEGYMTSASKSIYLIDQDEKLIKEIIKTNKKLIRTI